MNIDNHTVHGKEFNTASHDMDLVVDYWQRLNLFKKYQDKYIAEHIIKSVLKIRVFHQNS